MNKDKFRGWLINKNGYKEKTARDVISRLNRVSRYVDVTSKASDEDLILKLKNNKEFNELGMEIKSQLRKSIRLLKEFEKKTS